jgi:hypothetical protein
MDRPIEPHRPWKKHYADEVAYTDMVKYADWLEAENAKLRELVKSAFIEGWNDGHNYGIGCGHALAPRCKHKGSIEWCESDALAALEPASSTGKLK